MRVNIRPCQSDELERLIPLLDEEFIISRGRIISLQLRFPTVFCQNNLHNIFVCIDGKEIASALAMRQFDWRDGDKVYRGTMIGTVYTHPLRRGQGWASKLLAATATQLRERNVDFAVLWTVRPSFYARLGWMATDCSVLGESVLGEIESSELMPESLCDVTRLSVEASASQLEKIRQRWLNTRTLRQPEDYCQLPLPAKGVEVLWQEHQGKTAYALLGSNGETGFLYELVGDASCFQALWRETCRSHQHLFINERIDSLSCHWLAKHTDINWENKNLAMWLPLSKRVNIANLEHWHIPYFDRI